MLPPTPHAVYVMRVIHGSVIPKNRINSKAWKKINEHENEDSGRMFSCRRTLL